MDVGRVFFDDKQQPTLATVVALASHVGNVVALVKAWNDRKAYQADYSQLQQTRPRLLTAAERHDEANLRPSASQMKTDVGATLSADIASACRAMTFTWMR